MDDFTLIAVAGAYGTGVSATLDLLNAATALAPRVGAPAVRARVCSVEGGPVKLQSGMQVGSSRLPCASKPDRSVWIIPGLALDTEEEVQRCRRRPDIRQLVRALQDHVGQGGRVAASCSAVFLLGFAGLLEERRATTAWWLAPLLQRMNPRCQVDAGRMVCADGPLTTGGAAFAHTDLMLHLLRETCGSKLVECLSRFLLVDARDAQSDYMLPEVLASGSELVTRIVRRVETSLPTLPSVASLADHFCVSQRTLARHVQKATGKSTLALVQSIRLRKARRLLEQSRMSVEQVALAVGYGDPTALRRLMRRSSGTTPSRYRSARLV